MGFRQPNRTRSLFAQVDANRPQAARQKLGAAMGAQSVLQGQTQAQNQEKQDVQNTQTQMQSAGQQGRDSTSNLAGFKTAATVLGDGGKVIKGGTPVLQSAFTSAEAAKSNVSIAGPANPNAILGTPKPGQKKDDSLFGFLQAPIIGAPNAPGGSAAKDGYSLSAGQDANIVRGQIQGRNDAATSKFVKLADGTIARADNIKLGEELNTAYDAASDTLSGFEKQMTEDNLGRLAEESAFEQQQADLARVLAEKDSNVGKLRSLYGVGYDSGKYGALDSNLLQGQFNDLADQSTQNLENRDSARVTGDRVREAYLDESANQKQLLNTTKEETQKRVTDIDAKLGKLKNDLNALKGKAGEEAAAARKKITDQANKLEADRKVALKKATTDVAGKRARNALATRIGMTDKEAQKLTPLQFKALERLVNVTAKDGPDEIRRANNDLNLPLEFKERFYKNNPNIKDERVNAITRQAETSIVASQNDKTPIGGVIPRPELVPADEKKLIQTRNGPRWIKKKKGK